MAAMGVKWTILVVHSELLLQEFEICPCAEVQLLHAVIFKLNI